MNLVGVLFLTFFCLSAAGRATKLHFRDHRSSSECYSQSLFYKAESYFLSKTAVWLWLKLYYLATHTVCSSLLITVVQADDFKCDIMQLYFLPLMQCLWRTTTQYLWVCFIISSGDAKIIYGIPCQISKGFLICIAPFSKVRIWNPANIFVGVWPTSRFLILATLVESKNKTRVENEQNRAVLFAQNVEISLV